MSGCCGGICAGLHRGLCTAPVWQPSALVDSRSAAKSLQPEPAYVGKGSSPSHVPAHPLAKALKVEARKEFCLKYM